MNEEITFSCECCGKDFESNPDMMVEAGIREDNNEGEEWKGAPEIEMGAICLCLDCQDRLAAENE